MQAHIASLSRLQGSGLAGRLEESSRAISYILLGASLPFVLRPAEESRYSLIGDCYMHGIMDGEAMTDLDPGKYTLEDITLV